MIETVQPLERIADVFSSDMLWAPMSSVHGNMLVNGGHGYHLILEPQNKRRTYKIVIQINTKTRDVTFKFAIEERKMQISAVDGTAMDPLTAGFIRNLWTSLW